MRKTIIALLMSLAFILPSVAEAKNVKEYRRINLPKDRTVLIKGRIASRMAEDIMRKIYALGQVNNKPIYYVINTNGGSLWAGDQIIRAMKSTKAPSICVVDRAALSMGALIITHCDKVYIHSKATVLFHEGYTGTQGRLSEVFSYINYEKKIFDQLNKETAKLLKMSTKQYVALQKDEWWLTAREAVEIGLANGIVHEFEYELPEEEDFFFPFFFFKKYPAGGEGFIDMTYYSNSKNPYEYSTGIIKEDVKSSVD